MNSSLCSFPPGSPPHMLSLAGGLWSTAVPLPGGSTQSPGLSTQLAVR